MRMNILAIHTRWERNCALVRIIETREMVQIANNAISSDSIKMNKNSKTHIGRNSKWFIAFSRFFNFFSSATTPSMCLVRETQSTFGAHEKQINFHVPAFVIVFCQSKLRFSLLQIVFPFGYARAVFGAVYNIRQSAIFVNRMRSNDCNVAIAAIEKCFMQSNVSQRENQQKPNRKFIQMSTVLRTQRITCTK